MHEVDQNTENMLRRVLAYAEVGFIPPTKREGETVGRFAFLHPATTLDIVRQVLARTE